MTCTYNAQGKMLCKEDFISSGQVLPMSFSGYVKPQTPAQVYPSFITGLSKRYYNNPLPENQNIANDIILKSKGSTGYTFRVGVAGLELVDTLGKVLWRSTNHLFPPPDNRRYNGFAVFQTEGNLVFYDNALKPIWATSGGSYGPVPNGIAPYSLKLISYDSPTNNNVGAEIVIDDATGKRFWSSLPSTSVLMNTEFKPGQGISNTLYQFMYLNGNLIVVYPLERFYWILNSKTLPAGKSPGSARIQSDGNVVLYDSSGNYYWAISDEVKIMGQAPFSLKLLETGKVVMVDSKDRVIWTSNNTFFTNRIKY